MKRLFFFLLVVLAMAGCRSTHDIERVYVHDSIYTTQIRYDSIDRWHTHYEYVKGDTVYVLDSVYRDRWHTRLDTLVKIQTDTVTVEKEVIVEKKKVVLFPAFFLIALFIVGFIYFLYKDENHEDKDIM